MFFIIFVPFGDPINRNFPFGFLFTGEMDRPWQFLRLYYHRSDLQAFSSRQNLVFRGELACAAPTVIFQPAVELLAWTIPPSLTDDFIRFLSPFIICLPQEALAGGLFPAEWPGTTLAHRHLEDDLPGTRCFCSFSQRVAITVH